MTRIMDILTKIIEQIERNNPYGLIMKGGTALSLLYLNHHRESEDLDFDVDIKYLDDVKGLKEYIVNIFDTLKSEEIIKDYNIGKTGLASTNRFHLKVQFILHRTFQTKIDIDFVNPPDRLNHRGKLLYYTLERLFISKIITFTARSEFKDIIDIGFMLPHINFDLYENRTELVPILQKMVDSVDESELISRYESISKNVDLRIRDIRKVQMKSFIQKTMRVIRSAINVLKR